MCLTVCKRIWKQEESVTAAGNLWHHVTVTLRNSRNGEEWKLYRVQSLGSSGRFETSCKFSWHKFWIKLITSAAKTMDSHGTLSPNPDKTEHISFSVVTLVVSRAFWRNGMDSALCFVCSVGTRFLTSTFLPGFFPQGSVGNTCKRISTHPTPHCTPGFCDLEQLLPHSQVYISGSSISLLSVTSSTFAEDLSSLTQIF